MNKPMIWDRGSIHGDEYYTLKKTAEQIAERMIRIPGMKVWMPFNDRNSVWGGVMNKYGFIPHYTDGDFFSTEPPNGVQAIVSNPPFSRKAEILERTRYLGLPFVYILPFTWLNDAIPLEYGHQIILFRRRMHFTTPSGDLNKPRSNCFVLSNGLLKKDIDIVWD